MVDLDPLYAKIKVLNERLWESKVGRQNIDQWLANYEPDGAGPSERAHALFLLSQLIYFGDREVRELLRALFRDAYRYPIIEELRRANGDTVDQAFLSALFSVEQSQTRFLGIGNPAESGTHLLYYFRQENQLPKDLFTSVPDLFEGSMGAPDVRLRDAAVRRFVFIDDFCGSADQAIQYSNAFLTILRGIEQRMGVRFHISYLVMVANEAGLKRVRAETEFDSAEAVLELDDAYRSVSPGSKHFANPPPGITREFARDVAQKYGQRLVAKWPLGYRHNELLLGFHHNIPDNALPIIWFEYGSASWSPILPRYPKV
jgi:hypothetical protein